MVFIPGGVLRRSKEHFFEKQRLPFRKSLSPSRRQMRQTGSV
jgi:hypothetical protein